jgi:ABC-type multidrug transport system fused ATPase/permease subunit
MPLLHMRKPKTPPGTNTITVYSHDVEQHQRPLEFGLIMRMFAYMKPHAGHRNWLLFLTPLRAVQLTTLPLLIGWTIDGPIQDGNVWGTLLYAAIFGVLAASTHFVFHFRSRLALELGERVIRDLRFDLFRHIQRMPMAYFHRVKRGRILSRMLSDAEAVRFGVQDVLFVSMVQGVQMVVAAAVMAVTDWRLFLVILAMVPILAVINHYFRRKLSTSWRIVQESFSRLTATLAESVSGIRVTQSFVRQQVNADLFGNLVADHGQFNQDANRLVGMFVPLLEFNSQLFLASLLIIGGWQVAHGSADVGAIVMFFLMSGLFFQPIGVIGFQYNRALTAMAGAERIFKVLDTEPDWEDPPDATKLPLIQGRVEFKDVTFGYDPSRPVLHDINFVAEPGRTIALVGETGSGKTSIINLIAKFYLVTAGRVLIDEYDVRQVDSDSLHHQMGIVLQQNFLFAGSVMDNIRFAKPQATDDEVRAAAQKLDCLDLLESLPDGLHTEVGEGGAGISLGQRQLICFTRAMLANPRILILDEATSAVDTMTEYRIQRALERLLENRTNFVVAHRLSTIRHADCVLVLDNGRIVERGTHNQLLASRGLYANLYREFLRAGEA